RRLDQGQLGYQLVYEGLVQPKLFGISYDDRNADESFTVYDHPHVRIYQRVEDLSREEFRERFLWSINQSWEPLRYPSQQWLMLATRVSEYVAEDDSDWNAPALESDIAATLGCLVASEFIGISAGPLSASVLRRSPERGAFSARLIGL